jgi:hypothetical protein
MAVHHRNTASSHAQEPPLTIARVALYARVSTLNGQDPEMQLSELREYASQADRPACRSLRTWPRGRDGFDLAPLLSRARARRRQHAAWEWLNTAMTSALFSS